MIYKPLFLLFVLCVDTHNSQHLFFTFPHGGSGAEMMPWGWTGGRTDEAALMNRFGDVICYENYFLVCGIGLCEL